MRARVAVVSLVVLLGAALFAVSGAHAQARARYDVKVLNRVPPRAFSSVQPLHRLSDLVPAHGSQITAAASSCRSRRHAARPTVAVAFRDG